MKTLKHYITEAKEISKEVAIAVIKINAAKKAYDSSLTMNKMDRETLKKSLPKGTKLTRDVPGPSKGATFGKIVSIALGGGDYYFDDADFVKGDKTLVANAIGKKTFGDLAKKAGVKF
jgi:hypothetical protein